MLLFTDNVIFKDVLSVALVWLLASPPPIVSALDTVSDDSRTPDQRESVGH